MIFFAPLRLFAGGIHAKNHRNCITLFLVTILSSFKLAEYITPGINYIYVILSVIISNILIVKYAATSKKLDEIEIKQHRKISIIISCIYSIVICLIWNLKIIDNMLIIIGVNAFLIASITSMPIFNRK